MIKGTDCRHLTSQGPNATRPAIPSSTARPTTPRAGVLRAAKDLSAAVTTDQTPITGGDRMRGFLGRSFNVVILPFPYGAVPVTRIPHDPYPGNKGFIDAGSAEQAGHGGQGYASSMTSRAK
ncbi:hypothetical protein LIA77_11620 [Sarocladium implicatum]|nr:hypothetical protein LIA77_11620 [Sarocladium implicatum]